jgi:hypothetical protein
MALNGPIEIFQSTGSTEAATMRIMTPSGWIYGFGESSNERTDRSPHAGILTAFMNFPQAFSRGRAVKAYPFEIQRTKKSAVVESRPATASAPASIRGDGSLLDVVH